MESLPQHEHERKRIDEKKDKGEIEATILIETNLKKLELNKKAIENLFLYGCEIKQEVPISEEFNKVHEMRRARKIKCFQEEIKKYVPNYYISGLILMGKPITEDKIFSFYLKITENKDAKVTEGEIIEDPNVNVNLDDQALSVKVFQFIFNKKFSLSQYNENSNGNDLDSSSSLCVSSYLNICLGKILKKCSYYKDRTTRKILYYRKGDIKDAIPIGNKGLLFFPALKAVCETYDGNNIYLKLLPKRLLKSRYNYEDFFEEIMGRENANENFNRAFEIFRQEMINRRGIKIYNQEITKIEDVIFDNPYNLKFTDKNNINTNVGEYLFKTHKIRVNDKEMPIAMRYIDQGGKLKEGDRKILYIPCHLLEIVGNAFNDRIDVRKLVQSPQQKYYEIEDINAQIEEISQNIDKDELHNFLGTKFSKVRVDGQVINPPLIVFGNTSVTPSEGSFSLLKTEPYSKSKGLKNIDIYLLNLDNDKGGYIWELLLKASHDLGINLPDEPNVLDLPFESNNNFEESLNQYFGKMNSKYTNKENKTDFILMFMGSEFKNRPYYKYFKSTINKFDWKIPTQVILYDDKKFSRGENLSQFTNILCQMWAKKGNELYCCNFDFVPNTMVIAYSSMIIHIQNKKQILTSLTISIGTKLYEYLFYSDLSDLDESGNNAVGSRVSPTLINLFKKALKDIGQFLKKDLKNIIIYRDAVNEKQIKLVENLEISQIKKAINEANLKLEEGKRFYTNTKWCLILASKISEVKMFLEDRGNNNNNPNVYNIPVGTLVDRKVTSHNYFDFYLNSADSRQGTCSPTHYTVIYDDTELKAIQLYKVTYYLSYLSYNTTKSIKMPAPLYFVTRRNNFTRDNLKGKVINPKLKLLNISL